MSGTSRRSLKHWRLCIGYIKSRHLVVPSRNDGRVDMDIGALKGRKGYGYKGKGIGKGGMYKAKEKDSRAKECSKEKEKERAKVSKERKEKE